MRVLQAQLQIGTGPEEVGRARRWARSRLRAAGVRADEPLAETLVLLVSELVTNAVVHTGRPAVLRVLLPGRQTPGAIRVEVADTSDRPPRQCRAGGDDTGGRGLELVSGLADRWGWRREGAGKRVWCEVDRGAERVRGGEGRVRGGEGRPWVDGRRADGGEEGGCPGEGERDRRGAREPDFARREPVRGAVACPGPRLQAGWGHTVGRAIFGA